MKLELKERRRVLRWFDIAVECGNLCDGDLKLYDKIRETVEDEEDENDPLVFNPRKKVNDEDFNYDEDVESQFDMDEYSNDDKY